MDTNFYDFWTPTFQRLRGQQTNDIDTGIWDGVGDPK